MELWSIPICCSTTILAQLISMMDREWGDTLWLISPKPLKQFLLLLSMKTYLLILLQRFSAKWKKIFLIGSLTGFCRVLRWQNMRFRAYFHQIFHFAKSTVFALLQMTLETDLSETLKTYKVIYVVLLLFLQGNFKGILGNFSANQKLFPQVSPGIKVITLNWFAYMWKSDSIDLQSSDVND